MTIPISDVPAVSPGGMSLIPSERWPLSAYGVLTLPQRDGSTLLLWLDGAGRLCEQYYPATRAAALDRWREEYPEAAGAHLSHDEQEHDDGFTA